MMNTATYDNEPVLPTLVTMIFGLAKDLEDLVADTLAEFDLTEPLAGVLWQLDPASPTPTMRQLAAGLRCDPSTVTFLVDRLLERSLIMVDIDPADRRRKHVTLTPKGAEARRRLLAETTTRSSLAHLSPDEHRQLYDLLCRAESLGKTTATP